MNRLCFKDEPSAQPQFFREVVLDIQGVLVRFSLPPVQVRQECVSINPLIVRRYLIKCRIPRNPLFARQNVVISGLGLEQFKLFEDAIRHIDQKFERTVKAGEYEPYTTMEADGHPSISLSNRYFTKAHLAQHAIPIAFPANVDPKGHLKRAGGSAYVHLADNVVEYHGKERTVVNNEL